MKREKVSVFLKKKKMHKTKLKRVSHKNNYRGQIYLAKMNEPDQNNRNLSLLNLTSLQKSLLLKGPSLVPKPSNIDWHELH